MESKKEQAAKEHANKDFPDKSSWEYHTQYTSFKEGWEAGQSNQNLNRAEIEQDFKEINYSLNDLCRNPDRKDAGHAWIAFTDKFAAFRRKILSNL